MLTTDDLVASDDVFFAATGITDGELMAGVRYRAGGADHALAGHAGALGHHPHASPSEHQLWKLRAYSSVNFDSPGQRVCLDEGPPGDPPGTPRPA